MVRGAQLDDCPLLVRRPGTPFRVVVRQDRYSTEGRFGVLEDFCGPRAERGRRDPERTSEPSTRLGTRVRSTRRRCRVPQSFRALAPSETDCYTSRGEEVAEKPH
jgi:hypothetical protein